MGQIIGAMEPSVRILRGGRVAHMSGLRTMAALAGALASLLIFGEQALASGSSFGSKGSGDGQFNEPTGVAINETSGDVYVVDKGNDRVEIFSSSGAYIGQFNGSETPIGSFSSPEEIAVDNSCVGGALECSDESVLDVYVVDTGHHVIDKFTPEGKYLGQLTGTGPFDSFFGKLGVAVDLRGDVWVNEEDGTVDEFNNTKSNLFLSKRSMGFALTPGIAVDGEGHVYVIDSEHVVNFEKEKLPIGYGTPPAPPCHCDSGVAVDTRGDVYVDEGTKAAEYTRKGGLIGAQFGSGELTGGSGMAVNSATGPIFGGTNVATVYIADTAANAVWSFTRQSASVEACTGVQPAGADTLCGVVNPHGSSVSTCHFELSDESGNGEALFCSPEPPYSGEAPIQLTATPEGLKPGTTYHYRVTVTNESATTSGPEIEFTTAPAKPVIESESASRVTQHSAHLEAKINPEGGETSYQIWFLPGCSAGACERVSPRVVAKAADIGSGHEGEVVTAELTELEPGLSNNEYWVVASNSAGKTESAHQSFATPPEPRIESESASALTEHDATLEATINPEGLPQGADYQFQLVKNTSEYLPELVCAEHGVVAPIGNDGCLDPPDWPSGTIPLRSIGGSEGKPVSLDLASVGVTLQSGTTYHYRVLAAESLNGEDGVMWEAPAVIGADQTFTTVSASHARPLGGEPEPSPSSSPPSSSTPGGSPGLGSTQSSIPPPKTLEPKLLTRSQKLAQALKACKRKPKSKRSACVKQAQKKYGQAKKKHKGK